MIAKAISISVMAAVLWVYVTLLDGMYGAKRADLSWFDAPFDTLTVILAVCLAAIFTLVALFDQVRAPAFDRYGFLLVVSTPFLIAFAFICHGILYNGYSLVSFFIALLSIAVSTLGLVKRWRFRRAKQKEMLSF